MPKWLAFLIPITFSLAVLSAVGCSSDDDDKVIERPVYSQETGIANITISQGELIPAYSDDVRNYGVSQFYTAVSDFTVTVTLKDIKSRLTIEGRGATSGQAAAVALNGEGDTTIQIIVQAEDGKNFNPVSLTTKQLKPNTALYVLDGIGGAPVEGATITLKDANNRLLASNLPLSANRQGTAFLGLDPAQKYHIYAKGANSAEACFAYFDPSKENTAALYCLPGWAAPFVREAPVIERVSFSDNANPTATWKDMPSGENQITASHLEIPFIRVTAISRNPINYESGAGTAGPYAFPIQVAMDGKAWEETRFITWWSHQDAAPVMLGGVRYFRTTYALPMPYTYVSDGNITYAPLTTPDHWLDIVVYDQANNRTEQRLYLTLADAGPSTESDTNISAMPPRLLIAQGQTYGISMNLSEKNPIETQGVNPVDGYGVTCYNFLEFNLTDAYSTNALAVSDFPIIRGFEVYRSANNVSFTKIDTIHYAAPNRGVYGSGSHYEQRFTYMDLSPELAENVAYYYKIRAFNGNPAGGGYSPLGNSLGCKLLPAFVTQLTAPAHNSVVGKLWPTFRFRATNPGLFDANVSDMFFFSLCVKDVYDVYPVFSVPFAVDFAQLDEEGNPWIGWGTYWGDYFDALYEDPTGELVPFALISDDGVITIEGDNYMFREAVMANYWNEYQLTPGRAYEWTIFGESGDYPRYLADFTMTNSAFFYKTWVPAAGAPPGAQSDAFSFGSTFDYGLGSPNGFFIFTTDIAAE
jgi:hypothetical protein